MEAHPTEVEVFRGTDAASARERALVLRSRGIAFRSAHESGVDVLYVASANAELARRELDAYTEENRGWPPAEGYPPLLSSGLVAALCWAASLSLVFYLERAQVAGLPWWEAGRSQFADIRGGEWWRAVTSLTLHVDLEHLLSNAVFGAVFMALLAQLLGAGLAALTVVAGGALGNLLNAYVRATGFAGVGASTGVFAAIGILVALEWLRRRYLGHHPFRRWAPVIAGLVLLGYLGTSGERTDVLAHVTGWIAGFCLGMGLPVTNRERLSSQPLQRSLGALTVGLVAGAWAIAFATA